MMRRYVRPLAIGILLSIVPAAALHAETVYRPLHHYAPATTSYLTIGIGTYSDWSELTVVITWDGSNGAVSRCTVAPDCFNEERPPVVVIGAEEVAGTVFGFSPWAGYTPCEAVTHAETFTCPVSMNAGTGGDGMVAHEPHAGPDTQTP